MEYKKNNCYNYLSNQKRYDYEGTIESLEGICKLYPYIELGTLGRSFMGRSIPIVALGSGKSSVLYAGAMCGREYMTSVALIKFINEYCEGYSRGGRMYGNRLEALFCERTVYVLPMLDVDGVEYAVNGICDKDTLYDKLCDGEEDFECERGALNNFVRFNDSIKAIVALRQQKEGISFSGNAKSSVRAMSIAKCFSKITGYSLEGFGDDNELIFRELDVPHVSIRCGEGKTKGGKDSLFSVYSNVREILFTVPFMI